MFYFTNICDKKVLKSSLLDSLNIKHFFTTRESVISSRDLYELEELARDNKAMIANYLGVDIENFVSPVQTHSDNISVATKGVFDYPDTDALIVSDKNVGVYLNFADCTPIILYDAGNNIGAVVHAGWRGTASSILKKTLSFFEENYSSDINKDLYAAIGPAIGIDNYQVGQDVYDKLASTISVDSDWYRFDVSLNKYNVDLKLVNYYQLIESGMDACRIDRCNYCTYDSNDVFFSYRKENGKTARHSAVLKLN